MTRPGTTNYLSLSSGNRFRFFPTIARASERAMERNRTAADGCPAQSMDPATDDGSTAAEIRSFNACSPYAASAAAAAANGVTRTTSID